MASGTAVDISQGAGTVKVETLDIQPGLTDRMICSNMAIMTSARAVTVKATGGVTLRTDRGGIGEIRRAVWSGAVRPTPFSRWILTAGRSEVTFRAAPP